MLTSDAPSPRHVPRWHRRPAPANAGRAFRAGDRRASDTRSRPGCRAAPGTGAPARDPRHGSARALGTRVERPLFSPHAELHVGLTESARQVLHLSPEFDLASRRQGLRVIAPGEALAATLEELLLPFGDRRLAHLQPSRDVDLGGLALQDREHHGQFLVGCLERFATHRHHLVGALPHHTRECPTQSEAAQTAYTYDAADRQTSIDPPGASNTVAFSFDALDRDRTRSLNGTTTDTYGYVGETETAVLLDRTTDVDSAVDAMGDRIAISSNGTLGWTIPDLHGSMAAVVASNGASLTDAFRYDPYGEMAGSTTSALPTPWRYQGELLLTDPGTTDLYAGGARDYDPALGVFTSQDSVVGDAQNPLSLNRYLYAWGDPSTMTDPSGHMAVEGDDVCPSCNPGKSVHTAGGGKADRAAARSQRRADRREVSQQQGHHRAQPTAPNPALQRLLANETRIAASYDPRSPGYDDEAKMQAVAAAASARIASARAAAAARRQSVAGFNEGIDADAQSRTVADQDANWAKVKSAREAQAESDREYDQVEANRSRINLAKPIDSGGGGFNFNPLPALVLGGFLIGGAVCVLSVVCDVGLAGAAALTVATVAVEDGAAQGAVEEAPEAEMAIGDAAAVDTVGSGNAAQGGLRDLATQIRTAGEHPAAVNQRTIAVASDSDGNLWGASSSGFDAGQKAALEKLGVSGLPTGQNLHAEENLARFLADGMDRIGTSSRMPCEADEHGCSQMLNYLGVQVEP